MTYGQMTVGQVAIGQMTVFQVGVGHMTYGQMTVGQVAIAYFSKEWAIFVGGLFVFAIVPNQIGQFSKDIGSKFSFKSSPNIL